MASGRRKENLGPGARDFERAITDAATASSERFVLCLYVSGMTPRSRRAIENIQKLCEKHLAGRYDLQIVDIYQQPALAREQQIIAAPTLVKKLPLPLRKVIGEMADPGRVLLVLGVAPKAEGGNP
jgi:circadian clock protein KaiB